MRAPLTMDECLASRLVCDPFSVRDCCLVTDGAAAVVMVRADRARDLAARPAYLLGGAAAAWHKDITNMPDLTVTAASLSGPRAMAQAGVTPADIDVLELYDAFTLNTILFLEDLGFCAKGEGGAFVEDGRIAPGGRCPSIPTAAGCRACIPACMACSRWWRRPSSWPARPANARLRRPGWRWRTATAASSPARPR